MTNIEIKKLLGDLLRKMEYIRKIVNNGSACQGFFYRE